MSLKDRIADFMDNAEDIPMLLMFLITFVILCVMVIFFGIDCSKPNAKNYTFYFTKDGQEQQVDECRAFEGKVYCAKDGTLFTDIESVRVEEK